MEERRASVFVQIDHDEMQRRDSDAKTISQVLTENEPRHAVTMPARTRSSSCSSSNDTSDANSVDLHEERKKLALQLEVRNIRPQSRSPVTTLLSSSLAEEDLKSITPTFVEADFTNSPDDNVSLNELVVRSVDIYGYFHCQCDYLGRTRFTEFRLISPNLLTMV